MGGAWPRISRLHLHGFFFFHMLFLCSIGLLYSKAILKYSPFIVMSMANRTYYLELRLSFGFGVYHQQLGIDNSSLS